MWAFNLAGQFWRLSLKVHAHPGKFNEDWFKTQGYTQSAEFWPKDLFLQTNKEKTIEQLTKKLYNLKNVNSNMSRNARFQRCHIFLQTGKTNSLRL